MTPNERKTMEAVIALIDFITGYDDAPAIHDHRNALRAALDADPEPRACDPYSTLGCFHRVSDVQLAAAAKPNSMPQQWIALLPRAVVRDLTATQQYDADPPQEPGRETPEASK